MYRGDGIEARIISFGVGGGVLGIIGPMLALLLSESPVYFCLMALSYTFFAAVVAYIWPQLGWRTGLWFFLAHPFVLLGSFFLSAGKVPINWRAELTGLLAYAGPGLVGACFGGWLGAMISNRRAKKLDAVPPADVL
jgi:hypothetical protein